MICQITGALTFFVYYFNLHIPEYDKILFLYALNT